MNTDALILHYDFSNVSSTIVPDLTGCGMAGVIRGVDRGGARLSRESVFGQDCPVLTLSGGSQGGYLQLPDGILNTSEGFTISFYGKLSQLDTYGTICSFGADHCFYLSVLPDPEDSSCFLLSFGATKGGRSQETALEHWPRLSFGTWFHVILTMDASPQSLITLYLDGKKAGEARHRRMTAADMNGCRDCFFGYGSLSQNPLALTLGEIRIYHSSIAEQKAQELFSVSDETKAELAARALSGAIPSCVFSDLSLPVRGEFQSAVRWTSLTPQLVNSQGSVTRPPAGSPSQTACLEAVITCGAASLTRRFSFPVAALPGPAELLAEDVDRIRIPFSQYLSRPPKLPAEGENGSWFAWHSSAEDIYCPRTGHFVPPSGHPTSVTLMLEASLDGHALQKDFSLRFWPASGQRPGPAFALPLLPDCREMPGAQTAPVNMSDVSWTGPSLLTENQKRCTDYLLLLDADRMLYNFRRAFGQDTRGVLPPGGWEEPAGLLRGHSTGHLLSALAWAWTVTWEEAFREKAAYIIHELATLQQLSKGRPEEFRTRCTPANAAQSLWSSAPSVWGEGYLSAYPPDQFALLEQFTPYATIWAPYYTLHKLLAGFLDCAKLLDSAEALSCAEGIASWVYRRLSPLPASQRNQMWSMYIAGEYGGMNESLAELARMTGRPEYLEAAKMFDNQKVFDGLSRGADTIKGLHANQHIPQMIGAFREFQASGDSYYYRIARNFWQIVTTHYAYSIGGVGRGENFKEPDILAGNIEADRNCETCAAYNLLKLTGLLYRCEPESSAYMDYYERTMLNQIAASQNPSVTAQAHHGVIYMLPIGPGAKREYSNDYEDFTCCHGTGMENHVRYLEHAWHRSPDGREVYLNLFLSSSCRLDNGALRFLVRPGASRDQWVITAKGSGTVTLHIRIPYWCRQEFGVSLNGTALPSAGPDAGYYTVSRRFQDGDRLQLSMPWRIHLCYTPDTVDGLPAASVMYGPLVMTALCGGKEWLTLRLPANAGDAFREEFPDAPVNSAALQAPALWYGDLKFVPMNRAHNTAYHTYFKIEAL